MVESLTRRLVEGWNQTIYGETLRPVVMVGHYIVTAPDSFAQQSQQCRPTILHAVMQLEIIPDSCLRFVR